MIDDSPNVVALKRWRSGEDAFRYFEVVLLLLYGNTDRLHRCSLSSNQPLAQNDFLRSACSSPVIIREISKLISHSDVRIITHVKAITCQPPRHNPGTSKPTQVTLYSNSSALDSHIRREKV